jgi:hypothetical protein
MLRNLMVCPMPSESVSLSRLVYVEVGSRTDRRDTFFCAAKRKYPKKRLPGFRLDPALLAFGEGFRRAIHSPPKTSGFLAAPLTGCSRQKLRCSGRNNGIKNRLCVTSVSKQTYSASSILSSSSISRVTPCSKMPPTPNANHTPITKPQ